MNPLAILQGIAYAMTALSAAKSLTQDAPEVKNVTTGQASGGAATPQAQSVFQQQPAGAATPPTLPQGMQAPQDPNLQVPINALISAQSAYPQAPMADMQTPGIGAALSLAQDPRATKPFETPWPSIGEILSVGGNTAQALAAAAPLLGLTDRRRDNRMALGSPAGGQGGQSVFQMPQRQTLAQILAALPRMM